jgi:hypothetical protein
MRGPRTGAATARVCPLHDRALPQGFSRVEIAADRRGDIRMFGDRQDARRPQHAAHRIRKREARMGTANVRNEVHAATIHVHHPARPC